jgi:hypothetical protein
LAQALLAFQSPTTSPPQGCTPQVAWLLPQLAPAAARAKNPMTVDRRKESLVFISVA